ncbi:MAG TPA: 3'-5' exonuclease, partial [Candidatus Cloacimonadota bacterium]|nr:3'-5' exonuclease [Candidatus Cloacimonadota bacterium]
NRLFGSTHLDFSPDWEYAKIACAKPEGGFVQVDLINNGNTESKPDKTEIYQKFVLEVLLPNLQEGKITAAETAILMRKNDELKIMAQVLEENGIDYTLETSGSLFSHPAIKPVIFVLNFLVYEDFWELVKFLRSDLVLLDPPVLKEVTKKYRDAENLTAFLEQKDLPDCLHVLKKLKQQIGSPLNLIKSILEEFNFTAVFSSETDLKNLQRFLEVAAEFQHSNHEYTIDTTGFLRYCRSLADKDEYSRLGQSLSDSLKLLTIHKSKGLQFETVFAVFDVMSRSGGGFSGLNLYYRFADDFRSLADFAFTFNYDKVLQKSEKKDLLDYVQKRDTGDELNNLYVALTRAENNLFLYLHYSKKGDLQKFIVETKEEATVLKNIVKTLSVEFAEDLQETSPDKHRMQWGTLSRVKQTTEITDSR